MFVVIRGISEFSFIVNCGFNCFLSVESEKVSFGVCFILCGFGDVSLNLCL